MQMNEKTLASHLILDDLSYETEQFVNRVLEYAPDKFLAASWDNDKFIFIDHRAEEIS